MRCPLLLAPLALGLVACRGPDPAVIGQAIEPPASEGAPYKAAVTVENKGGGEGQIEIIARLRARATGRTAAQRSEMVDLLPHEKLEVILELRPALPAPYDLSVEASYPPP
jgi:hypothetical protein